MRKKERLTVENYTIYPRQPRRTHLLVLVEYNRLGARNVFINVRLLSSPDA